METTETKTERTVTCKCSVLRFVYNNHSVFELVCKVIIMSVIIPWGSVFLNGAIVKVAFSEYFSTSVWMPIAILAVMVALFALGVTLSVKSIVRFSKKIKTVSR